MAGRIRVEKEAAIGWVVFDHPERYNALTADMWEAVPGALAALAEVFEERPLLPSGARRSLLPALPGLFLAVGAFGTLVGLTFAVDVLASSGSGAAMSRSALALEIGLALRAALWGLLLSILSATATRWLQGRYAAQSDAIDQLVEAAYGSITPGEVATRSTVSQREGIDRLSDEFVQVTFELNEGIKKGLSRIEASTAKAASLVSEEQRGSLDSVTAELREATRRGVDEHLGALRDALGRAVAHQDAVTEKLGEQVARSAELAEHHETLSRSLERAATVVDGASASLAGAATRLEAVPDALERMGNEIERLPDTLGASLEPVRSTLVQLDEDMKGARAVIDSLTQGVLQSVEPVRAALERLDGQMNGVARGLIESTDRSSAVEKSVDDLRQELADESLQLRGAAAELVSELRRTVDAMGTAARELATGAQVASPRPPPLSRFAETREAAPARAQAPVPSTRASGGAPAPGEPGGGLSGLLSRTPSASDEAPAAESASSAEADDEAR